MEQPINNILPNNSFFLDLLDHEAFLEKYEHNLRGEIQMMQQNESGQYVVVYVKRYSPKMNEEGITQVISFLRTICEKIISITNFDDEMMQKMIYNNIQDFTDRITENWYNYEFKSIADLSEINSVARNLIVAQFSRSAGGMTLQAITSNTSIQEVRNPDMRPQMGQEAARPGSGSILGRIFKV